MSERRTSFIDRVLDGHARIDGLQAEVEAWLGGNQRRPLHEVLGLDAAELELVAATPDALRYIVHARRFGQSLDLDEVRGQRRVRDRATRIASEVVDPFDLAEIETWRAQVDAICAARQEPSHA
ncbi:MAG: hypothetical protein JWM86_1917 [Thermoleophilia bacterium]|nr:hypothetical protein [Thermoleophilia bacterium]